MVQNQIKRAITKNQINSLSLNPNIIKKDPKNISYPTNIIVQLGKSCNNSSNIFRY